MNWSFILYRTLSTVIILLRFIEIISCLRKNIWHNLVCWSIILLLIQLFFTQTHITHLIYYISFSFFRESALHLSQRTIISKWIWLQILNSSHCRSLQKCCLSSSTSVKFLIQWRLFVINPLYLMNNSLNLCRVLCHQWLRRVWRSMKSILILGISLRSWVALWKRLVWSDLFLLQETILFCFFIVSAVIRIRTKRHMVHCVHLLNSFPVIQSRVIMSLHWIYMMMNALISHFVLDGTLLFIVERRLML
jgi:hypothetical protein